MTISRGVRASAIPLLLASVAAMPAAAQTGNGAAPQTLPGLDNFSLPASNPTPQPTPVPAPAPAPTPSFTAAPVPRERPTPRPSPTASPEPRSTPTPVPSATATPVSAATPTPLPSASAPVASPTPVALPTATSVVPTPVADEGGHGWLLAGLLVVLGGGAAVWWWRRRRVADEAVEESPVVADTPPSPAPVRPAPAMLDPVPVAAERAQLTLALHPRRAGLNLLSATVEAELVVRNDGRAPAAAIRIGAALIGAATGQGSEVAALFAQPPGRPATPPFPLAPGEERRVRLVVAQSRADIVPLTAGGRAMFVPVVTVNAVYDAGQGAEGQSARGFAVGVERVDSAKLAPFWLDQPARMHEQLGVRPYGTGVER